MKKKSLLILVLYILSCNSTNEEKSKTEKQGDWKEKGKNIFSKGLSEGVMYKVFPIDSMDLYASRFASIVLDSSDLYVLSYAKAFRYLTNKRKQPTDEAIKDAINNNPFIHAVKD